MVGSHACLVSSQFQPGFVRRSIPIRGDHSEGPKASWQDTTDIDIPSIAPGGITKLYHAYALIRGSEGIRSAYPT